MLQAQQRTKSHSHNKIHTWLRRWTNIRTTQQTELWWMAPSETWNGSEVDEWTASHMEHPQVKWPLHQTRTTQHPRRSGDQRKLERVWETHRGRGQGCLANQAGVRDGHAEAQPRARLLHGHYRRLEVAGERRGGGRRGGRRVGGLWRKQSKRKVEEEMKE